jgi:catechol 2,3-dioxygenase-like lactoylglutathione lyase family enzyme
MNLRLAPHISHVRAFGLALLTALVATFAQAQSDGTPPPPFNGIAHVAIRVHDLAASVAFYQKLGFEQAFDLKKDGVSYESFIKINDHQFIELYPVTETNPDAGFLHLCFEGADLNAIYDDYISHGLTPTAVRKAGAGNLLFTMAGPLQPSGPQNIEYTQYMPGSLHSNDQGKHLGPDRVADKLVVVALAMKDTAGARDFYINQLHFKPIAGDQTVMHLPGESGQEIEIVAATLGTQARLTLQSENLAKAARSLHKEGIAAEKRATALSITDPDGNILLLEPR